MDWDSVKKLSTEQLQITLFELTNDVQKAINNFKQAAKDIPYSHAAAEDYDGFIQGKHDLLINSFLTGIEELCKVSGLHPSTIYSAALQQYGSKPDEPRSNSEQTREH